MKAVLQGGIDVLTTDGYIQGWAFDSDALLKPRVVYLLSHGQKIIAGGVANQFRQELVVAQRGVGWCGFTFRVACATNSLKGTPLSLVDAMTKRTIYNTDTVAFAQGECSELRSIEEVKGADPTLISSIAQLEGCDQIFSRFIRINGVENFVRKAYGYVLSRPVDARGLEFFAGRLRQGSISPHHLLKSLCDSEEFQTCERCLGSPMTASFPFGTS